MEAKSKQSRQSRKRNATHESIMHNAKRLFEKKGLGNVTIEEITEKTDIARSTFFSHFDSVDALIYEIAETAVGDIVESFFNSKNEGKEGIISLFDKMIEDTCPYPYLSVELFTNSIIKTRGKTAFYNIERILVDELAKISEYNRDSIEEKAALLLGAYFGIVFQKLIKDEEFDKEKIKSFVTKQINTIIGD